MLDSLTLLYRCPQCRRPGHGDLRGGAVRCAHCGTSFVSYNLGEPRFTVLGKVNSGEAMLNARKALKRAGIQQRLKVDHEARLLIPYRLTLRERISSDGGFRRVEEVSLTTACDLEELLLPGLDPLRPLIAETRTPGLTLEPLEETELAAADLLIPAVPPAEDPEQDPLTISSRTLLLHYPLWRIVFTLGDGASDWPLVIDGLGGQLISGRPPRIKRTMPAFYIGVPALGAYALGCLINLFTRGLGGFEWLTFAGAFVGLGGLFYLRYRREQPPPEIGD